VSDEELRAEIGASVVRFIAGVVLHNATVAQQVGLGSSDSQFLTLLDVHGPLTAGRLAELSGLTTGTVTGVVDRLEAAGFVRRERDPADRRRVVVTPRPEGKARLSEHYREHGEHLAAVLASRDAAQLQVLADFFAEVTGVVDGG
jgi:DNA-binding MarR family transcriptional regulator